MSSYQEALDRIATRVVAPAAVAIDRDGAFPSAAIAALGEAGLLGLVSDPSVGGQGEGPRAAARVVERLARECGSTAMVVCMHYAATAVLEKLGPLAIRQAIASGAHLATLAFSETGSRSQFWAPVSTAIADGDEVVLTARKSFATAAHHADSYVWTSKPVAAAGASTLWLVPRTTPGVRVGDRFDGLGLRGNDSCPITAEDARVPASARLGEDGGGFDAMMSIVLPWFNLLCASTSIGLMESAVTRAADHAAGTTFAHVGSTIAELPTVRAFLARARIAADAARCLVDDTATAIESGRGDAILRVLESKACAGDAALEVTDLAMRVCGGSAFRKEVGVERVFRDARAAAVMSPTSDQLYDFLGKAICGLPLF